MPSPRSATLSPVAALQLLQEGNVRFVEAHCLQHNLLEQARRKREADPPFAVVLSCIDERVAAQLIFDQGLSHILSIRIVGNVVTPAILGSMEYAVEVAGVSLILVLGHTDCGAIAGAIQCLELGHLTELMHSIRPAIAYEEARRELSETEDFPRNVARRNAILNAQRVYAESTIVQAAVERGTAIIVPALYDLRTGAVHFDDAVGAEI